MYPSTEEVNQMARPYKLASYSQEEVRAKVKELGTIAKAAKFYECAEKTVSNKIGFFVYRSVDPKHHKELKELLKIHTKSRVGELMGYSQSQMEWFTKKHKIKCSSKGKPKIDSNLTHYEMNNMDEVVKDYATILDCADELEVSAKTIHRHLKICRERKREAAHGSNWKYWIR